MWHVYKIQTTISLLSQYRDRLDGRGSIPGTEPKTALEPTQSHAQRVPGAVCQGVKQSVYETDHSPPSNAEVQSGRGVIPLSHTSSWRGTTLPLHLHCSLEADIGCYRIQRIRNGSLKSSVLLLSMERESYFTTDGLPPISLSWRQAPWHQRPVFFSTEHFRL
jgi:hypothetical protein